MKTVREQDHEYLVDCGIERAKKLLAFLGLVLRDYAEGLTEAVSAERLSVSRDVIWHARKKRLGLPRREYKKRSYAKVRGQDSESSS